MLSIGVTCLTDWPKVRLALANQKKCMATSDEIDRLGERRLCGGGHGPSIESLQSHFTLRASTTTCVLPHCPPMRSKHKGSMRKGRGCSRPLSTPQSLITSLSQAPGWRLLLEALDAGCSPSPR